MSAFMIFLIVYVVVNLVVMAMYFSDKSKAEKGKWRTKESTLILAALFGPFGAVAGMEIARHKTRKLKFKIVYVFLLAHILILGYAIYRWGFDLSF